MKMSDATGDSESPEVTMGLEVSTCANTANSRSAGDVKGRLRRNAWSSQCGPCTAEVNELQAAVMRCDNVKATSKMSGRKIPAMTAGLSVIYFSAINFLSNVFLHYTPRGQK